MGKKFQRKKEDFVCENCGERVQGDGYTNHCPKCLFSRHVDNFPGDRGNDCLGMMKPVRIEKDDGKLFVVQVCQKCGFQKRNKVSNFDDQRTIEKIMQKMSDSFWKK